MRSFNLPAMYFLKYEEIRDERPITARGLWPPVVGKLVSLYPLRQFLYALKLNTKGFYIENGDGRGRLRIRDYNVSTKCISCVCTLTKSRW
jgi:hypothetical protein